MGGGLQAKNCYHVATFRDSLEFDMEHDIVLKNMTFDLLILTIWSREWWVCRKNKCDHVAAFFIPFNLTCNKTLF